MSVTVSSFIPSGSAVVSRTRDQFSVALPAIPQGMTIYVRLIIHQMATGASLRLWGIENGASTNPRLTLVITPSGVLQVAYVTTSGSTQIGSVIPAIGDMVECRVTLSSAGVVSIGTVRNGGVEVLTVSGVVLTLPQAWATPIFWLNSHGTSSIGVHWYRDVLIVRGVQSMATCQRLANTVTK